ncbi:CLUMA_CG020124, isoform A [Clunio marinus]|uniref:DNA-directed RNA polymerase III subunit RPC3 n=1 Tax=Clunio marinus TaxID=568069 RepID=A0A1J1J894_9DIPT|nr:CLUMA_CG020124, isoform A [Clunio marinus]
MTANFMKLCSLILQEHFGETAKIVGENLFTSVSKTITGIVTSTKLSRKQVIASLSILVQHQFVKFTACEHNESIAEYSLLPDKILLMLRYPHYVCFILKKYGNMSALLLEEVLHSSVGIAELIIARCYSQLERKNDNTLKELRDAFCHLVNETIFIRHPNISDDSVPQLKLDKIHFFELPDIDLEDIKSYIESGCEPSSNIYWTVNFDCLHRHLRDKILVNTIDRQIDVNAGEAFQFILQLMEKKTDAWNTTSNPISYFELKQLITRKSSNSDLVKYFDQYISVIEKNESGFLKKIDESGGGIYTVNMVVALQQLVWTIIENVITQKFGSKATRIFRVVKARKYLEQEEIQREAMIPGKEAKLHTYRLLEEGFLQIHTIKKVGGGGTGPVKAFYLFHINQYHIVLMLIETCYKALYNSMKRGNIDKEINKRLMEKSMRLQFIVDAMKERGESEEVIHEINETLTPPEKEIVEKTKSRLKHLESSEIVIDEMLFLFQLFIYYQSPANK